MFTTEAAKSLVTIIGKEYLMGQRRVEAGFIKEDKMLGTVLERLNRMACQNINLRRFLDEVGFIPEEEDEDPSLPWAEDPRDPRDCDVRNAIDPRKEGIDRSTSNVLHKRISGS
jgi:hypothetical protein